MKTKQFLAGMGFLAISTLASSVLAQETSFYIGASVGQSRYDVDTGAIDASARAAGFTTSSTSSDDTDTAWKIFGGFQFHPNFAVELHYTDLGKASFTTVTTGPVASVAGEAEVTTFGLDLLGMIPVAEQFTVFAKVGFHRWDVDARAIGRVGGAATTLTSSDNGTDFKFGLGARYDFTKNLGLRVEWERFNGVGNNNTTGESDINFFSAGLQYRF